MTLSELKEKLKSYENTKGFFRFGGRAVAEQISHLKDYITSLEIAHYKDEDNVYYHEFLSYLTSIKQEQLLTDEYLNSNRKSAEIFKTWRSNSFWQKIDLSLVVKKAELKIEPPKFEINALLSNNIFSENKIHSAIPKDILAPYIQSKQHEMVVNMPHLSKLLNSKPLSISMRPAIKSTALFNFDFLVDLGLLIIKKIDLFTTDANTKTRFRNLCKAVGETFINEITQRDYTIDYSILKALQIFIEMKESKKQTFIPTFDKRIEVISKNDVVTYLCNKITSDNLMPFVIMLDIAEATKSTGIVNTSDYLVDKFKNSSGEEVAYYLIKRFNEADDSYHLNARLESRAYTPFN